LDNPISPREQLTAHARVTAGALHSTMKPRNMLMTHSNAVAAQSTSESVESRRSKLLNLIPETTMRGTNINPDRQPVDHQMPIILHFAFLATRMGSILGCPESRRQTILTRARCAEVCHRGY
jgi:hypothetical protein